MLYCSKTALTGLPVIAGRSGGAPEAVIDGDGAQLVLRPEFEVRQLYVRALEASSLRLARFAQRIGRDRGIPDR